MRGKRKNERARKLECVSGESLSKLKRERERQREEKDEDEKKDKATAKPI